MAKIVHSVLVPWADVRGALDLLGHSAAADFKARPVGNRVVIDCEAETDAMLLTEAFAHARRLEAER